MDLESRMKCHGSANHRMMSPADTIERIEPFMSMIGVTRVADITHLHPGGEVPVYSAIRPTDVGELGISVYNGKGLTHDQAKAGAMMEAVERYVAETWLGPVITGTYAQILEKVSGTHMRVLDPETMRLHRVGRESYDPEVQLEWAEVWEMVRGVPALVPLDFILLGYSGPQAHRWFQSSNGLASGNCTEEAVCHALAELIERDAFTMAVVRMGLIPRTRALVGAVTGTTEGNPPAIDHLAAPYVDLATLPDRLCDIVSQLGAGNSEMILRQFPTDTGLAVFTALMTFESGEATPFFSGGFGCHVNAEVAATRAITEAIQSRNALIQGAREDIPSLMYGFAGAEVEGPRPGAPLLWEGDRSQTISFHDVPSQNNPDILDDVRIMVENLKAVGIEDVFVANLSHPDIPASVVKIVVPDLEAWFLSGFDGKRCNLGRRAKEILTKGLRGTSDVR